MSVLADESVASCRFHGFEVLVWLVRRVGAGPGVAGRVSGGGGGCVAVDVVDDESLELLVVPDDGAVEQLAAQGCDPAFGERVRDRCLEDLGALGSEISSNASSELAGAVAHERTRPGEPVSVVEEQVPALLG